MQNPFGQMVITRGRIICHHLLGKLWYLPFDGLFDHQIRRYLGLEFLHVVLVIEHSQEQACAEMVGHKRLEVCEEAPGTADLSLGVNGPAVDRTRRIEERRERRASLIPVTAEEPK